MLEYLDLTFTLVTDEGRTGWHQHGGRGEGEDTGEYRRRRRRRRREIFRYLICAVRGPVPPPPTRDDAAPFRGCILTAHDPSASGAAAEWGTSSDMTKRAGRGRDAHEPVQ